MSDERARTTGSGSLDWLAIVMGSAIGLVLGIFGPYLALHVLTRGTGMMTSMKGLLLLPLIGLLASLVAGGMAGALARARGAAHGALAGMIALAGSTVFAAAFGSMVTTASEWFSVAAWIAVRVGLAAASGATGARIARRFNARGPFPQELGS